jgi:hypothetical protein
VRKLALGLRKASDSLAIREYTLRLSFRSTYCHTDLLQILRYDNSNDHPSAKLRVKKLAAKLLGLVSALIYAD